MITLRLPVTLAATAALGLAACTNPDGTTNNTNSGLLVGAGLGALAGGLIADDAKGAIVGGIAGAAVGGGVGALLDRQQKELQRDLSGSGAKIINTGSQLIVSLPEAITFDVDSTDATAPCSDAQRFVDLGDGPAWREAEEGGGRRASGRLEQAAWRLAAAGLSRG